jgi:hypothetical protein
MLDIICRTVEIRKTVLLSRSRLAWSSGRALIRETELTYSVFEREVATVV